MIWFGWRVMIRSHPVTYNNQTKNNQTKNRTSAAVERIVFSGIPPLER